MPRRILVAGATGCLGREIVRELGSRGHFVRALGRDPLRLERHCATANERVAVDAMNPAALPSVCTGMDRIVSCIGASVIPSFRKGFRPFSAVDTAANILLARAAQAAGAESFLYVSVFADDRLRDNDFVRSHERVVNALRSSGGNYAIIRPTGFFPSLVQIMRGPTRLLGLLPETRRGEARTNPIDPADLARFCADLLESAETNGEYSVGGPEVLTRRQIAALVWEASPRKRCRIPVPTGVLRIAGYLSLPINRRVSELMHFIAEVLSHDYVAPQYGNRTLSEFLVAAESRSGGHSIA